MKTLGKLVLTTSVLAVSACSGIDSYSEVEKLNAVEARGSTFTRALANEYRLYSNTQLHDYFDYPDALHFARKGLAAASGENVLPEPVTDWNLDEFHSKQLAAARSRLIIAYDYGARESSPELSAKAQAQFDCWIEVQEEYWTDQSADECRLGFQSSMDEIEAQLVPVEQPEDDNEAAFVEPAPEPAPIEEVAFESEVFDINPEEPMAAENAMYLIFFNWDSAEIGSGALSIVDAVVDEINTTLPSNVSIIGHTDTSGSQAYNERLAVKRAKAAKDKLVERGVSPEMILLDAKGETDLLVPTPDNVREPANRRVNISFQR